MKAQLALVAAAASLLLGGCFMSRAEINEPLDQPMVDTLVPGQSTAADVTRVLGAPADVVQLGKRSAWRYEFSRSKSAGIFLIIFGAFNQDTRSDRVWVFFDENDVLTNLGSTFEAADTEFSMPWQEPSD